MRQVASCGLATLLDCLKDQQLEFAVLSLDASGHYFCSSKNFVDASFLVNNIVAQVTVQMLKDQFSDYEDLNVLTPVRYQTTKLIACLVKYAQHK